MIEYNDIFAIEGEHFEVIAIHKNLDKYEETVYELSSRHTPSRQTRILTEDEVREFDQVTDTDSTTYLEYHADKLANTAEQLCKNKNNGEIQEVHSNLADIQSQLNQIRRCKRELEDTLDSNQ